MPYVSQGLPVLLQRPAGRARRVILESVATATGVLLARHCAHRAILHGLRAPRVLHDLTARDLGVSPDRLLAARIPGARGRTLSAWLVMPPGAEGVGAIDHRRRVPAVLVLHGWGSNAALMAPVVPPLHAAGLAVLLICNTQNRSSATLRALRERGYGHVRFVSGGMSEWARRGWPLVRPAAPSGR